MLKVLVAVIMNHGVFLDCRTSSLFEIYEIVERLVASIFSVEDEHSWFLSKRQELPSGLHGVTPQNIIILNLLSVYTIRRTILPSSCVFRPDNLQAFRFLDFYPLYALRWEHQRGSDS